MSTSRTGRLLEMLHLLSSVREISVAAMAERFGVTERTIFRDVAELQALSIPLVRGEHGYRLMDGAMLRPLNLTAKERAVLQLALANPALGPNFSAPGSSEQVLERVVDKLHAANALGAHLPGMRLAGPERTGEVNKEVARMLEEATNAFQTVEILYTSITTPGTRRRRVDPFGLVHRQGVWYCAGHCHVHDEMRVFRLDRIEEVSATEDVFEASGGELDNLFADSWSVFQGESQHDVRLRVEAELAPLFRDGAMHGSGEVVELEDGQLEYRLMLSHLEEIARYVVGFGGRVRVLGPPELEMRVREIAELTLASLAEGSLVQ